MTSRGYWENRPDFADAMRGGGQTPHFHATDAPGDRALLDHWVEHMDRVTDG